MVDSYTHSRYRAPRASWSKSPNNDIATPTEIARSVTVGRSRNLHADAAAHHARPRSRAARGGEARHHPRAGVQRPGPETDAARRRHRAGQVLRDVAIPADDLGASAADPAPTASGGRGYIDALLARLDVDAGSRQPARGHRTFRRRIREFAARAANAFAEEYVSQNLALKVQTLEKSAEWLTGEVERQGKLVQESELKLAQYKRSRTPARSTAARTSSSRG